MQKDYYEKLHSLRESIQKKNTYIALLNRIPFIARYNALLYEQEELVEEYTKMQEVFEKQVSENCSHPLWYLNSFFEDENNQRIKDIYYCQCLRCKVFKGFYNTSVGNRTFDINKVVFSYNRDNKIVGMKTPFEVLREEYLEYDHDGYTTEEIRDILLQKYGKQNKGISPSLKMKPKTK